MVNSFLMSELGIDYMSAVAISGAALGGIFSSMQGYLKAGSAKKFSPRMFMGALITSLIAGYAVVDFASLSAEVSHKGYIGLFFANLLVGMGADKLLGKAKKK